MADGRRAPGADAAQQQLHGVRRGRRAQHPADRLASVGGQLQGDGQHRHVAHVLPGERSDVRCAALQPQEPGRAQLAGCAGTLHVHQPDRVGQVGTGGDHAAGYLRQAGQIAHGDGHGQPQRPGPGGRVLHPQGAQAAGRAGGDGGGQRHVQAVAHAVPDGLPRGELHPAGQTLPQGQRRGGEAPLALGEKNHLPGGRQRHACQADVPRPCGGVADRQGPLGRQAAPQGGYLRAGWEQQHGIVRLILKAAPAMGEEQPLLRQRGRVGADRRGGRLRQGQNQGVQLLGQAARTLV